jgi:hypothetical protein
MAWHDNCMNFKEWHAMTSIGKPFTIVQFIFSGSWVGMRKKFSPSDESQIVSHFVQFIFSSSSWVGG